MSNMNNSDQNHFSFTMHGVDDRTITLDFSCVTWMEVIDNFEDFLRGCGYVLNGHFELIDDNMKVAHPSDDIEHSEYYYDTERNKPLRSR